MSGTPTFHNTRTRLTVLIAIVGFCIGCDLGTKRLAVDALHDGPPMSFLGGLVKLVYAENVGAFGSLGAAWPAWVKTITFILIPVAVLLMIAVRLVRQADLPKLEFYGLALVVGSAGNLVERIQQGYVVDFMWLGIGFLHTNIFNVADLAIVAGVILLFISGMKKTPEKTALPA